MVLKSDGVSEFTELFNGANRLTHLMLMIQFSNNKGSAIHFLTSLLSLLDEYNNISWFNSKIGLFKGIISRAREQFSCLSIEYSLNSGHIFGNVSSRSHAE